MKCSRCDKVSTKLFASFGKKICLKCKNNRPNKGKGNSGMRDRLTSKLIFEEDLHLERVPKSDGTFGHYFFSHYPESKGIVGRCLCYLVYKDREVVAIIGGASPPKNYKIFQNYMQCDEKYFVNNNVFRIVKTERNLGTQILKLFRNQIKKDYYDKYGDTLKGIVTFVEKPRSGSLYKADNWELLGETQGKRMRRDPDTWEKVWVQGEIKHIFGYKYK